MVTMDAGKDEDRGHGDEHANVSSQTTGTCFDVAAKERDHGMVLIMLDVSYDTPEHLLKASHRVIITRLDIKYMVG